MAKIKVIGNEPFVHAGHKIFAQFKHIDGYNIELIEGFAENDNHSQARISALHNSLHRLTRDDKEIDLDIKSDGGTNIPADYDPEKPKGLRFLKDALLQLLVTKYAKYLPEELEASFGKYAPDEVADDSQDFPTASAMHSVPRAVGDE